MQGHRKGHQKLGKLNQKGDTMSSDQGREWPMYPSFLHFLPLVTIQWLIIEICVDINLGKIKRKNVCQRF